MVVSIRGQYSTCADGVVEGVVELQRRGKRSSIRDNFRNDDQNHGGSLQSPATPITGSTVQLVTKRRITTMLKVSLDLDTIV